MEMKRRNKLNKADEKKCRERESEQDDICMCEKNRTYLIEITLFCQKCSWHTEFH